VCEDNIYKKGEYTLTNPRDGQGRMHLFYFFLQKGYIYILIL